MKSSLAPLRVDILTIFPSYFKNAVKLGTIRIGIEKKTLVVRTVNLRDFAAKQIVDDYPYGGGAGMLLKPEPIFRAVASCRTPGARVIYMTPQGQTLSQRLVEELARERHLVIICGRYKGIDARLKKVLQPMEISIGDYVLPGGEPAALILLEAASRFLPDVLGDINSCLTDSFQCGVLDAPYFTRPRVFRRQGVPKVLLSGNHSAIDAWRRKASLANTLRKRPDLLTASVFERDDFATIMEVIDGKDP